MMTVSKACTRLEAEGILQRVRDRDMRVLAPTTKSSLASRKKELRKISRPLITRAQTSWVKQHADSRNPRIDAEGVMHLGDPLKLMQKMFGNALARRPS